MKRLRTVSRWGLAGLLLFAGIAHHVYTEEFLAQVPMWLPLREPTVIVSGLVEIGFAVALVGWHGRRREVGWALASYFAVVFVGNVFQAIEGTNLFALDTDAERGEDCSCNRCWCSGRCGARVRGCVGLRCSGTGCRRSRSRQGDARQRGEASKMPMGRRRASGNVGRLVRLPLLCITAIVLCAVVVTPAPATFPGADGRIAFGSNRAGSPQIFTMAPDGSDVRQLTSFDKALAFDPAWAPDGSSIVFGKAPTGRRLDSIWVMDPDGTDQHRLVGDRWFRYIQPTYSPDGSMIVFSRCYPNFTACDLETADADGGNLQRLTPFVLDVYDQLPQFSPDGTQIAFSSFGREGVVAATYVMASDGTAISRVTPARLGAVGPDWAPDGSTLAVHTHCCDPKIAEIYSVDPDGTGLARLTDPAPSHDFTPAYSPSGEAIVFERALPDFSRFDIWVMAPDGSGQTRLTRDGYSPAWGPA